MDELLKDFLVETADSLNSVDMQLVQFEREPQNQAILRNILRLVHSIKGTCGFLGLPRLEALTHAAETLMGQFRDGAVVTTEAVGVILAVIDRIKAILAALEAMGAEPEGRDPDLIEPLLRLAGDAGSQPAESEPAFVPNPAQPAHPGPPARSEPEPPAAPIAVQSSGDHNAAAGSIRVNLNTLERLLNLVSELVLTRNQLLEMTRGRHDLALGAPLQRLSLVTGELQDTVMQARMQPIGHAWQKLPRLVRDLSLDLRKDVALFTHGADTELDRQVLEHVRDPLTHLVRNAIDHGIEHPEDRIMLGKPAGATITLSAYHSAGAITIEVADDGRGLDYARIRAKAAKLGLVAEAELERMSDAQLAKLIFQPGFSTADRITSISGRGVGLDVVQANVEQIGGAIDVRSTPGQGAVFTLRLPLTLAIVPALLVGVAGQRFALPQAAVIELVRIQKDGDARIERVEDVQMLRLRGQLVPLASLAATLGLAAGGDDATGKLAIVLSVGSRRFAVVVDTVLHTEEIVVKPLATQLRQIALYSGNTILGDGSVVLILEPNNLARAADISDDGDRTTRALDGARESAEASSVLFKLLLFRVGGAIVAAPVSAILRLEDVTNERIDVVGGRRVVQYHGRLMPVIDLGAETAASLRPCLVVAWEYAAVGLIVDEILDVIEDELHIDQSLARPGFVGSAIIGGRTIEILDAVHYLADAVPGLAGRRFARPRDLVVLLDNSAFFRDLLTPVIRAAGYTVQAVDDARSALAALKGGPSEVTLLVANDVPDMKLADFLAKARGVAAHKIERIIVMASPGADPVAAWEGDVDCVVSKFDRQGLIDALSDGPRVEARAA